MRRATANETDRTHRAVDRDWAWVGIILFLRRHDPDQVLRVSVVDLRP